jgi:hypothetical protein
MAPLQRLSFDGSLTVPPAIAKELPPWVVGEPIKQLDSRASSEIARTLQTDQSARVGLLELTSHVRKEVRWLALRCLGYVGQFRDMVAALNDAAPAHRLDWPEYIEQLREAVARDSESAAAVRQALEQQYPQQAAELYRMLRGYSDRNLQEGADRDLVRGLDDDTLAVRVLSIWNLKEVTGLGRYYQPEQTAAKRQQAAQRWRQRLKANEIRLKTAEEKAGAAARENATPVATETGP